MGKRVWTLMFMDPWEEEEMLCLLLCYALYIATSHTRVSEKNSWLLLRAYWGGSVAGYGEES